MISRFIVLLLLVYVFCCSAQKQNFHIIKQSSDSIKYIGRIAHHSDSSIIYWSGSAINFSFEGTEARVWLKDELGLNYFNVILDGDSLRPLKLRKDSTAYTLAKFDSPGKHIIQLIKRTEFDKGKTAFYGLEINGKLLPVEKHNGRLIEYYGNSITAGYAIEDYSGKDSPDSLLTNNYYTYAAITARHFNADYQCIVKSGIGIMVGYVPYTMPEIYDRLNPNDSLSKWDFNKRKPDVVVVNLFQNDASLFNNREHVHYQKRFGKLKPGESEIVGYYQDFIKKLRSHYPDAFIICALGSMSAVKPGSPWPSYISNAVNSMNDPRIVTHFFPYTSTKGHPRKEENRQMAEALIKVIEQNVKW